MSMIATEEEAAHELRRQVGIVHGDALHEAGARIHSPGSEAAYDWLEMGDCAALRYEALMKSRTFSRAAALVEIDALEVALTAG